MDSNIGNNSGGYCGNNYQKGGEEMREQQLINERRRKHLCIECGQPVSKCGTGYYSKCDRCRSIPVTGSICWRCRKATNSGCSWSRDKKPVEGWTATEKNYKGFNGKLVTSYCVIDCPEFEGESR